MFPPRHTIVPPRTKIFMTGVTGYIGGSVLFRFMMHPKAATFSISALVRTSEKALKLRGFGVTTLIGSHADLPLIEKAASEAEVVIGMADADNIDVAKAILRGLKTRHAATGIRPIYIHTSGTGVLADTAAGEYHTETIYNDALPDQIETLAPTQPHRIVDLELVQADEQGYVKTYIVLPSTIYGIATGALVDSGVQNPYSIQVPALIDASLDRGRAGMVGQGKNIWPNVHIDDIAALYILLYMAALSDSDLGHGREGFYFGENGEHTLYDLGKAVGQAMVDLGKTTDPEPTTFTKEEINKYFKGSDYLGSNSRCRADRSRSIGWEPVRTTDDLFASIGLEIEATLKRNPVPLR